MTKRQIYLDNSATTRICPEALDKYVEVSREHFGNPSSLHTLGFDAEKILDLARGEIRRALSFDKGEVIFCASGSEANNLAILGRAYAKDRYKRGAKIITTDSEHASVNEPLEKLSREGYKIARIPTLGGVLDLEALARELTADTVLVTLMLVNNETGALYDVLKAAKLVHASCPDALVHIDATQSFLKVPMNKTALGADMITVSSHKIEGPKGVGALVVDEKIMKAKGLSPVIFGGGQEKGLRSGTENVPAIAAFGEAVRVGRASLDLNREKLSMLRALLIERIASDSRLAEISPTLPPVCAPHILNITLPSIKSETMLHYLSSYGIFVSSGSACSSNTRSHSGALVAYGRSEAEADCSIRISFSHTNEPEDVDELVEALASGLQTLQRKKR
ncbi:MAG: cysteine desulfurase [Clostridia bacterium]|nr:cysteine desulfurase [Clostridia bacterium]